MAGFKILLTVSNEADIPKSEFNRLLKTEWTETGEEWHKKFRRSHFAQTAYTKYGYTARSKRYQAFKQRHLGHTIPLVLSGTSRSLSEQKTVSATSKGVSVAMPVRVFNFKSKNSKVDKRKEFTTVIESEVTALESRYQAGLEKQIKTHRSSRTVGV